MKINLCCFLRMRTRKKWTWHKTSGCHMLAKTITSYFESVAVCNHTEKTQKSISKLFSVNNFSQMHNWERILFLTCLMQIWGKLLNDKYKLGSIFYWYLNRYFKKKYSLFFISLYQSNIEEIIDKKRRWQNLS